MKNRLSGMQKSVDGLVRRLDTTEGKINKLKGTPPEMIYPETRGEIRVKTRGGAAKVYGTMWRGLTCVELKS